MNDNLKFMLDNKGSFYILDAILAIVLILIVFLVINSAITMPTHEYSYETKDIRTAQDVMELLVGKIDFTDQTFISEITGILKEGKNSKESVSEVSEICEEKLDSFNLKHYEFCENNVLDGEILASNADSSRAGSVSVATRTYGDYSYTLYVW